MDVDTPLPRRPRATLPRVVIVGGGFGGLAAARALAGRPLDVVLVDRRNHHLFQPLLYQVASATLSPADIASPIRHILRSQANAEVLLAEARSVDPEGRRLLLDEGSLPYDFLILATGASHSTFGHGDWAEIAPGLKTLEDALEIRRRVLLAFERAEREPDRARRRALLTFVVVGAGPTGVEMAGTLKEMARLSLRGEFRHLRTEEARVVLAEAGDAVLPAFGKGLSGKALASLRKIGVEVRLGQPVKDLDAEGVLLGEDRIPAQTVIWAAGVAASPLGATLGVPLDRAGRVEVGPELRIPGHPEIFVIGDLARFPEAGGDPLPGTAPVAIQMGKAAARAILDAVAGRPCRPFRFRDRGSMATIGRGAAVAQLGPLRFSGRLAWLAWLFVHLMLLVGFRNRLAVLLEWSMAYATTQRRSRLILGAKPPGPRREAA